MDISIIIVNWNVRDLLRKALSSLYAWGTKYTWEVLVVDNASQDNSAEMVAKEFPQVKLLVSEKNLGFAAGNNLAIKQATGKVIFFLNPDTEMHPGTVDFIVEAFRKNPRLGALGVKLLNSDGSLQPSCKSFPDLDTILWNSLYLDVLFPKSKIFGKYNMTWFAHATELEVDQPMGAALAVSQTIIATVGMFDERYFMYFDEVDFCYRIKKAGWQIRFFPQVQVTHHWGRSTSQAAINMNKQWYLSFFKYLKKNRRYPDWVCSLALSLMIWLKACVALSVMGFVLTVVLQIGGVF